MGDLTKNFSKAEFACKCGCGQCNLDARIPKACQTIRNELGAAVTVSSGVRCVKRNAAVGGVKDSYPTQGKAADLSCAAGSRALFLCIVNLCDQGKLPDVEYVIGYPKKDFVHIDVGDVRKKRFAVSG